jgi:flavin reductase (DIM6/NTAB) family NADH-FMN oxidoreductase RutF
MSEQMNPISIMSAEASRSTVDPDALRQAMRRWTSGVAIVTAQHQGVRHGMTVNSFTSVSLQPPVVLVTLEQTTRTHALVTASGVFGVTILSSRQQALSQCFSGHDCDQEDRFTGLETHSLVSGAPMIAGGLAYLDCRVLARYASGNSTLFIAEVLAAQPGEINPPLIYLNRQYRQLQD